VSRGVSHFSKRAGLSLIELMISLAIGMVISLGVVNLFLQSKVSFQQDEETARLQENGRWALRYLSRELSMTGFYGNTLNGTTIGTAIPVTNDCGLGWALDTSVPLEHLNDATDADATTAYDCLATGEIEPGTDILAVRRTKDTASMLDGTAAITPENNKVYLRVQNFGSNGALVKGSDLTVAEKTAGSGIDTWEYQPQLLFIRSYSMAPGDGVPSLCIKKLTTDVTNIAVDSTVCLVEGVENLQVEYGLDQSTPPDYAADFYTDSPTAAQLEIAVNARIYVLTRSVNEVPGYVNDKSYQLGDTSIAAANDGYYRRLMQTTVMLRNGDIYGF
jgi:Tfp pilus assembly protein PilW